MSLQWLDDIFSQLSQIPRNPLPQPTSQPSTNRPWAGDSFDVYKPRPAFKKSNPGIPDFRVFVRKYVQSDVMTITIACRTAVADIVCSVQDQMFNHDQLRHVLTEKHPQTQLKIGVVDGINVSFLAFGEPPPRRN